MKKVGRSKANLDLFPKAFRAGMKARSAKLSDTGASAPSNREKVVDWDNVDVLLIVASDDPEEVDPKNPDGRVGSYLAAIAAADSGLELCVPTDAPRPPTVKARARSTGPPAWAKRGTSVSASRMVYPNLVFAEWICLMTRCHPGQDLLHPGKLLLAIHASGPNTRKITTAPTRTLAMCSAGMDRSHNRLTPS